MGDINQIGKEILKIEKEKKETQQKQLIITSIIARELKKAFSGNIDNIVNKLKSLGYSVDRRNVFDILDKLLDNFKEYISIVNFLKREKILIENHGKLFINQSLIDQFFKLKDINNLKKENEDLKEKNNYLKDRINKLEQYISYLENENKKLLERSKNNDNTTKSLIMEIKNLKEEIEKLNEQIRDLKENDPFHKMSQFEAKKIYNSNNIN